MVYMKRKHKIEKKMKFSDKWKEFEHAEWSNPGPHAKILHVLFHMAW